MYALVALRRQEVLSLPHFRDILKWRGCMTRTIDITNGPGKLGIAASQFERSRVIFLSGRSQFVVVVIASEACELSPDPDTYDKFMIKVHWVDGNRYFKGIYDLKTRRGTLTPCEHIPIA